MMKHKMRVRLKFEVASGCSSVLDQSSIKTFMYLINKEKHAEVSDVEKELIRKFGFFSHSAITLSIDGFALMSSDEVDVIRDDDEITVMVGDAVVDIAKKVEKKPKVKNTKKTVEKVDKKSECIIAPIVEKIESQVPTQDHSNEHKEETKKSKKHKKSKSKDPIAEAEPLSVSQTSKTKHKKEKSSKHEKKKAIVSPPEVSNSVMTTPESLRDIDLKAESNTPMHEQSSDSDIFAKKKKRKHKEKVSGSPRKVPKLIDNSDAKNYDAMLTVSFPPRVDDIIAFKLLEMAEDYSPIISDFQEAIVCSVEGTTPQDASLQLEMLGGPSKMRRSGRFELGMDDSNEEVSKTIGWSRLIDPKLVK